MEGIIINFKELVQVSYQEIPRDTIIFTKKTRLWCQLSYPNRPNGCPNYGKNKLCHPFAPYLEKDAYFNSFEHYYLIIAQFDFKKYKDLRRIKHPNWSEAQLGNKIHWQKTIKLFLKREIKRLSLTYGLNTSFLLGCGSGFILNEKKCYSLEAVGIYVYKTLDLNHIEYEQKPKDQIKLICLLAANRPFNHSYKNTLDKFMGGNLS